jgi:hypothetical protein
MQTDDSSEHKKFYCCICEEEIDLNRRAYWGVRNSAHMHCAEKQIDVYKVQVEGGGPSYYDDDFSAIGDMLKDADYGEKYIIVKEKMSALKFKTLPEFTGF